MNWYKRANKPYYHTVENHIIGYQFPVVDKILQEGLNSSGGQFLTDDINFAIAMKQQMDEKGGEEFSGSVLEIFLTPEQESKLEVVPQKGEPDGLFLPESISSSQIKRIY